MVRNEGTGLRRALVCRPGREYVSLDDPQRHNFLDLPDLALAQAQHDALTRTLREHRVAITSLPELPGHPNSVFTRDPILVTGEGYVHLRMGLSTRRGEEAWLARHLEDAGFPCVGRIELPGTVEGGDVILAGRVAFVGHSGRTNEEGIRQLRRILSHLGVHDVRVAPVPDRYLHIGGAMSMVAPDRVVACSGVFPRDFFSGFDVIWVARTRATGANVICLAPNRVIADAAETSLVQTLEDHRVTVIPLDLSEFVKGGGGPTCLIQPLQNA